MFERIVRSSQHGRFDANGESWKRAGDSKLNCAPNRLRGQGSATTGGEEAFCKVTTIDSGMSPCLYRRSQEQGNEWQPSNAEVQFLGPIVPTDTG